MYNAVIGEGDVLTCVCPSVCQQGAGGWAGGWAVSLSLAFTQENVILYIICLHSRYRVYNAVMGEGNVSTCVCLSVCQEGADGQAGGWAVYFSLAFTQENFILYIVSLHSWYPVYHAVMGEGNVLTCVCPSV